MSETERETQEVEFVNYMPAMPSLSDDSSVRRAFRKLFRRRGGIRTPE